MATIYEDVACTRCGCVCDDLSITVERGRVVEAARACDMAEQWFVDLDKDSTASAVIEGVPAPVEDAIHRTAEILIEAKYPLVYGLSRSSTACQRADVRLADRIGASIDTRACRCHAPSIMAIQRVGESTCSLGEAKNRCDLVVFWGCDPVNSHPRHGERYSLDLTVTPHPICQRYIDFLINASYSQPFDVLLAVHYGVEVSYLCTWSSLETKGPYAEFIDRWSNLQFTQYVQELLDLCNQHPHPGQQRLFDTVMRHERDFWRMTWEG